MKTKEKKINLEDIWGDDKLGREKIATFLTTLINQNSQHGAVINLDSPWGTGKTFFLNRWYEDLCKNDHICVKFSAWESDFIDDPLTAFISEIKKCLDETLPEKKLLLENEAKKLTNNLVRAGATFLLDMGKTFVKELAVKHIGEDTIGKAKSVAKYIADAREEDAEVNKWLEDASQEYWDKKSAMRNFRSTLSDIINNIKKKGGKLPIYVFVDELDRCKPTYSIQVLEVIKHLFNVEKVAFVLATDTTQLCESIKAVYGSRFNSRFYLGRFFDLTYRLPRPQTSQFSKYLFESYDLTYGDGSSPNIFNVSHERSLHESFYNLALAFALSLREQQQSFMRIKTIMNCFTNGHCVLWHYLLFLIFAKLRFPDECRYLLDGRISFDDFAKDVRRGLSMENNIFNRDFMFAMHYFCSEAVSTSEGKGLPREYVIIPEDTFEGNKFYTSYLTVGHTGRFDKMAKSVIISVIHENEADLWQHLEWVELSAQLTV